MCNEKYHKVFEAVDAAMWNSIEEPTGGIDKRAKSLNNCVGCIEAYIETRRKAFEDLLQDERFWRFPVSLRPAEKMNNSSEDKAGDDRADDGNKPIVATLGSHFPALTFIIGSIFGGILQIILVHFL